MRKRDAFALSVLLIVAVGIASYADRSKDHLVRYDCRMAEISPDIPIKVKELCRQARAKEQGK
jgi:hypothetical protein